MWMTILLVVFVISCINFISTGLTNSNWCRANSTILSYRSHHERIVNLVDSLLFFIYSAFTSIMYFGEFLVFSPKCENSIFPGFEISINPAISVFFTSEGL